MLAGLLCHADGQHAAADQLCCRLWRQCDQLLQPLSTQRGSGRYSSVRQAPTSHPLDKVAVLLVVAAACPSQGAETYCQRAEQLLCDCVDREDAIVNTAAAALLPCVMQRLSLAHVQQPSNVASQNVHVGLQLLSKLVKYVVINRGQTCVVGEIPLQQLQCTALSGVCAAWSVLHCQH